MQVTLKDAHRMLKEPDCLFTYSHLCECRKDPALMLFTWSGIDFYLTKENNDEKNQNNIQ